MAREFTREHNLNEKMYVKLQGMLKQQMAGLLSRINEDEDEEVDNNSLEK